MEKIIDLKDAFIHELSDIYDAENQIAKALPELASACCNKQLAQGFQNHLQETEGPIQRIEDICDSLDIELHSVDCEAMEGLIKESNQIIKQMDECPLRDALLIAGAQKVEHYEIASYGCLVQWAKQLGYNEVANILQQTLDEEKSTDEKLNQLATSAVNEQAGQQKAA